MTATESETGGTEGQELFLTREGAEAQFEALRREQRAERARDLAQIRVEIADLRGEMRAGFAELRGEMSELRAELRGEMSELRGEIRVDMQKLRVDLTWRMVLVMGAMLAAATALDRLLG